MMSVVRMLVWVNIAALNNQLSVSSVR